MYYFNFPKVLTAQSCAVLIFFNLSTITWKWLVQCQKGYFTLTEFPSAEPILQSVCWDFGWLVNLIKFAQMFNN